MSMTDFAITSDGELLFQNGDMTTVEDVDFYEQHAMTRIKSISIDWYKDGIGADLEELLGKPNSQENAQLGEEKIISALIVGGLFDEDDISISYYPSSKTRIGFEVTISKDPFASFTLDVSLDLVKGVMIGV